MKYKTLFFDLDGTLWDLRKNSFTALQLLFDRHEKMGLKQIDFNFFFKRYHHHNDAVWALYRQDKIEKSLLRTLRFQRAFEDAGLKLSPQQILLFADDFMDVCPIQPHLLDGTHEVLEYCVSRYDLYIITNGFIEVQGHKMNAGNLNPYFKGMINSEHCGVRKPNKGIFDYAIAQASAHVDSSLMIGDDWEADILGARDYGMDQVFLETTELMMNEFNQNEAKVIRHNFKPTYRIKSLLELLDIL
jgi:putative hydrolase of the HAD superfamily